MSVPEAPTMLVLAGLDDIFTKDNASKLTSLFVNNGHSPSTFKVRFYPHQKRGFADRGSPIEATSPLNDMLKWFRKHNNGVASWRIGKLQLSLTHILFFVLFLLYLFFFFFFLR